MLDKRWYQESNYIVVLNVNSEEQLLNLIEKCEQRDVKFATFREPDLGDSLTCVVVEPTPEGRKICRGFRLALSECTK